MRIALTPRFVLLAVCKLCNVSDAQRFYDDDDSTCKDCKEHMAQKMIVTWSLFASAIVFALLFHCYGQTFYRKLKQRYARQLTKWKPLMNWLRILWGTYQILSKVPTIYQLSLPTAVKNIIDFILPAVDLGLGGVSTVPLQCLGFRGYLPQLIFVMVLPPLALTFAYPLVVTRGKKELTKRSSRASRVGQQMQQELPLALWISFLAFPVVSSQACVAD